MVFWSRSPPPPLPPPESSSIVPEAPPPSQPPPEPPRKPTREEAADAELADLLATLDREHSAASISAQNAVAEEESVGSAFPGEMNCLTAFDEMYYCYSLGGQFLNVYRYGAMRDCTEKSADWRFCMRTKTHGAIARKAMIMARNKEKAMKWKTGPSSEDIWSVRTEPVKKPFSGAAAVEKDSLA